MDTLPEAAGTISWARSAARFLGRPERRLGAMVWPLLLMRGFPFGLLEPPPGAVEVFRRSWWRALPPDEPCRVDAQLAWVTRSDSSTEVAVASVARSSGMPLAGNLVVLRVGDTDLVPSGRRSVPRQPEVPDLVAGRRFVVDAEQIERLEDLLGRRSPVTDSNSFAHHQGFPAALTPSLVLLHRAFDRADDWGSRGTVDMWLPRPIPRGAVTEVCRSTTDSHLAVLRVIGRAVPAAICQRYDDARVK